MRQMRTNVVFLASAYEPTGQELTPGRRCGT